jgi:hypothetical protein
MRVGGRLFLISGWAFKPIALDANVLAEFSWFCQPDFLSRHFGTLSADPRYIGASIAMLEPRLLYRSCVFDRGCALIYGSK